MDRARGEARRHSDWDVAIFVKGAVAPAEATMLSHIGSDLFFDLVPRIISPRNGT
jgi:hypothetical protein